MTSPRSECRRPSLVASDRCQIAPAIAAMSGPSLSMRSTSSQSAQLETLASASLTAAATSGLPSTPFTASSLLAPLVLPLSLSPWLLPFLLSLPPAALFGLGVPPDR